MPTEAEFDGEADLVERFSTDVATIAVESTDIVGASGVFGEYGDVVDVALCELQDHYDGLGADLDGLAAELTRRAQLCAQYTIDYRAWEQRYRDWQSQMVAYRDLQARGIDGWWPGGAPIEPAPPFLGAEVG